MLQEISQRNLAEMMPNNRQMLFYDLYYSLFLLSYSVIFFSPASLIFYLKARSGEKITQFFFLSFLFFIFVEDETGLLKNLIPSKL